MKVKNICLLAVFAALTSPSFAWNANGHGVIAQIADSTLNPKAKAEVDRLLQIGVKEKYRNVIDAAAWADAVRSPATGPWHYINWHFWDDGRMPTNQPDSPNVVTALTDLSAKIGNEALDDEERAKSLRYVLHFVGDIHQPLHCVARDSNEHPDGDRGGNDFSIITPPDLPGRIKNLHSMWDAGCGLFITSGKPGTDEAHDEIIALADKIKGEYLATSFVKQIENRDFESWSKEGLDHAKSTVYTIKEGDAPDQEYLSKGQALCSKLAAIAGYRLAALLNRLLG